MQNTADAMDLLDLMTQPSFCVNEHKILKVNPAAAALLLAPGMEVSEILCTGEEEYAAYTGGCLHLTLTILGQSFSARVNRMQNMDVFQLEPCQDNIRLQALALAAQSLRGPLHGMMVCTDRLFPEIDTAVNPNAEALMAHINRNLFQLLRTVGNMSDAGRYLSEEPTRQEVREIGSLVDEFLGKAKSMLESSEITLEYTGLSSPVSTTVDTERLERAIYNLISNAVKFTPKGGCIQVSLSRKGSRLYFSIADNGSGISKGLEGQVFSSFERAPQIEDGRMGIGLGMVLVCAVAAQHGGTVLVDRPQETSTRVTMTLAIRTPSEPQVRSPLLRPDYAGERDHVLIELSGVLPAEYYNSQNIN